MAKKSPQHPGVRKSEVSGSVKRASIRKRGAAATVEKSTSTKKFSPKDKSPQSSHAQFAGSRTSASTRDGSFPIVAIGASAGGLEAYKEFFEALAADTGMAFVLIQHLDPSHHSMLAEIIGKNAKMPVEEVKSGVAIQPNCVYVIPPNAQMALENCVFQLSPRGSAPGLHLAVNFFMRSLAREEKSRAIGIVLSGTGADGTLGLEDIKAEGGITFAQDPATARYDGMPRSAIDSGCADFVLAPKDIAKELARIQNHPYVRMGPATAKSRADAEFAPGSELDGGPPDAGKKDKPGQVKLGQAVRGRQLEEAAGPPSREKDFAAILDQLRRTSGADFSQYKPNTIHRRALRRMVVLRLDSLGDYARYMKDHPEEAEKLFDDVLIPVTSFFRDLEVFEALKSQVYPSIVKDKSSRGSIRMWAPGCSTGEETYSLAMTLLEYLGDRASSFHIQIFGTDLNEKGIQKARAGVYRETIADEISPERMKRFFIKVDEGYRVNKAVRDMCVFAKQNLASDPPFSQMNVVACRNLLIYIQPVLQKKIVPILHYALKPNGFLVLGGSESLAQFPDLFSTVDKKHRIYAKKPVASRLHYDFAQNYYPARASVDGPREAGKSHVPAQEEVDVQAEADRLVLQHHAPVGVVVNGSMEVIQFRGRTTPYLEPAPGKPSLNLLKLARNGLAVELRALISAAARKGAPARKNGVLFDGNGHKRILNLSVTPLGGGTGMDDRPSQISRKKRGVSGAPGNSGVPGPEKGREQESESRRFFLVLFDDATPQSTPPVEAPAPRKDKGAENRQAVQGLTRDLAEARDALRMAVESEDALKEEFQSANEEILSANEELQSTNEELETSKEELQSANEELNTVNVELRSKNAELQELSNDILNLLNSTRIPVVMLDSRLCIRRITPTAARLIKAMPSDVGRPIGDIKLNLDPSDLTPDGLENAIRKVLDNLQPADREVRDLAGRWHQLSIQPYRTQDNKIDGAVLALQDIDAVKRAGAASQSAAEFYEGIANTVRGPLLALDAELRVVSANRAFLEAFQVSREETAGQRLYELGNGQWDIPGLRTLLERVLPERQSVTDFEVKHDFETIGPKTMLLNARRLDQANPLEPMILLAIEDITERKRSESALIRSEKLAASGRLAAALAHEINNPLQAVMNLLSLIGKSPRLDEQDRNWVKLASEELEQVAHLTRQSLSFYRENRSPATGNVEVKEVLESVVNIYMRRIEQKKIALTKRYSSDLAPIQSYPGEIRQVFSTLLLNAIDAVPDGGSIDVHVHKATRRTGDKQTQGIQILVADNGPGISPGHKAHIFEPFFTTKGDQGTGLGLWVAQAIVARLGGSIQVRSVVRPGKSGACFTIFLPLQLPNPGASSILF